MSIGRPLRSRAPPAVWFTFMPPVAGSRTRLGTATPWWLRREFRRAFGVLRFGSAILLLLVLSAEPLGQDGERIPLWLYG